jgi:hypothetical protein
MRVTRDPEWFLVTDFLMQGLMAEGTDRYTATRLSAELGLDNRKMRDILTRVNPVQVKGRSKFYLLRDVIPHAAKYLGAPDVIDLNVERARKVKAEAELAEIELAKEREDLIEVDAVRHVWGELVIAAKSRLLSIPAKLAPVVAVEDAPATCKYLVEEQINEALDELAEWLNEWADDTSGDAPSFAGTGLASTADIDGEPMGRPDPAS